MSAGTIAATGCNRGGSATAAAGDRAVVQGNMSPAATGNAGVGQWLGFDRNDYPGDAIMSSMRSTFAFTGYWLTNPPGETMDSWIGKRSVLQAQGWGFLVLANGRFDVEILKAQKDHTPPAILGQKDAAVAVASARREAFPPNTILFLDQEEGGRLLPEQAAYLLGWTEAVAATGFRPGVYASGQQVADGPGVQIDTIEDIRARVESGNLHPVAIFDAHDQCPPAPGCSVHPGPLLTAGDPDIVAWQFAQSPRRPEITQSCQKTYAADGNCYAPGFPQVFLDMNVARSADPSAGR